MKASGQVVVADFEAGIGTLTRMGEGAVDAVVLVVEATAKSLEVATRAVGLVREKSLGQLVVVANRLRTDEDLARLTDALPGERIVAVPNDPLVLDADRRGAAPLDAVPGAPAVRALAELAEHLVDGGAAGLGGAAGERGRHGDPVQERQDVV